MSGGVCEASAFARYGYRTTGIAFPLGNYHNGAPDGGVEAEYINVAAFIGGIRLMIESAHVVGERGLTRFNQRMGLVPEDLKERLVESSG